jgi:hypothetical protein
MDITITTAIAEDQGEKKGTFYFYSIVFRLE